MEFKKGFPFAPKPSAPKFVDPQDVDFAIQDLLKGRRIGAYQDLAPGENRSVLFPSALATIAKGGSRRGYQLCLNGVPMRRNWRD